MVDLRFYFKGQVAIFVRKKLLDKNNKAIVILRVSIKYL